MRTNDYAHRNQRLGIYRKTGFNLKSPCDSWRTSLVSWFCLLGCDEATGCRTDDLLTESTPIPCTDRPLHVFKKGDSYVTLDAPVQVFQAPDLSISWNQSQSGLVFDSPSIFFNEVKQVLSVATSVANFNKRLSDLEYLILNASQHVIQHRVQKKENFGFGARLGLIASHFKKTTGTFFNNLTTPVSTFFYEFKTAIKWTTISIVCIALLLLIGYLICIGILPIPKIRRPEPVSLVANAEEGTAIPLVNYTDATAPPAYADTTIPKQREPDDCSLHFHHLEFGCYNITDNSRELQPFVYLKINGKPTKTLIDSEESPPVIYHIHVPQELEPIEDQFLPAKQFLEVNDEELQWYSDKIDLTDSALSEEGKRHLKLLIYENKQAFVGPDGIIGHFKGRTKHRIDLLPGTVPIQQPLRRVPIGLRKEVVSQIQEMLDQGIIRRSDSPFAAPIVLVKKKDGNYRFAIDYRMLNEKTVKAAFVLPNISDILDECANSQHTLFTSTDLQSGFHAVDVLPAHRERTAFATFMGLFEYLRMPFGLSGAPKTFQQAMEELRRYLSGNFFIYLDDIILASSNETDHLRDLKK
uniref:Reverse transcriptase domain-containing protein n=1 Tax=Steinernema glaseri TaxID=37863 RepID=A0A1I7YGA9_9BILA